MLARLGLRGRAPRRGREEGDEANRDAGTRAPEPSSREISARRLIVAGFAGSMIAVAVDANVAEHPEIDIHHSVPAPPCHGRTLTAIKGRRRADSQEVAVCPPRWNTDPATAAT
ncbi:MAG TPA: hypothetical protein VGC04_05920 [Cellulomonas sp.]